METKDLTKQLKSTIVAYRNWQIYAGCKDGSDDMMYMDYSYELNKLENELEGKIWHLEDCNIGIVYTGKNCNEIIQDFIKEHKADYCDKVKLSVEV